MKKILFLETKKQHLEVLYPQIILMKNSGYKIFIAINKDTSNIDLITSLRKDDKINFLIRDSKTPMLFYFWQLKKFIKRNKIDLINLNTLEGFEDNLLYLVFLSNFKTIRNVHNLENLLDKNKYTGLKNILMSYIVDKVNEKIDYNLVLNESVLNTAKKNKIDDIDYFYPIFYKEFLDDNKCNLQFKDDKIKIGVQGGVSFSRRNYMNLISSLKKLNYRYKDKLNIYIIGNINSVDGNKLKQKIKEYKLENQFNYFNEYISYKKYFNLLNNMDYLLPLIDRNVPNFKKYNKSKITSTQLMSLAFSLPMINSDDFEMNSKFKNLSINYHGLKLEEGLKKAININKKEYNNLLKKFDLIEEIKFEYQKFKYQSIVNKVMKEEV